MRLLQYTISKLTLLLLVLIGIWGIFFYLAIHHEIMDETDDMLRSYRDIFIKKALHDPTLLRSSYETTFDRYAIRPVAEAEAMKYEEKWLNMEKYFPEENEHIPIRVLKSVFLAGDDQYYELEISMSTLERDDMIETLFRYLIALYILLLLCIIIGNSLILKRAFTPLQKLLAWIASVVPGKSIPSLDNETSITEFSRLNTAVEDMSKRSLEAYRQQKEFIENASHELQTPLAVATNKIELLSQNENLTEDHLKELDEIYRTVNKAVHLNKSLLLLSRIENRQFGETNTIDLGKLIEEITADMLDIYAEKQLQLVIPESIEDRCVVKMNEPLTQILLSNLLKNAFVHTPRGGQIRIDLQTDRLIIRNTGQNPLNKDLVFRRFYRSEENLSSESTGLGLAIVQSIATFSRVKVNYTFDEQEHVFTIILI